jgi:capsular polysaccharide biosynthesis protein
MSVPSLNSNFKHLKLSNDILLYSDNYYHFWQDVVASIISYANKNKLSKDQIILYNSLKFQEILSLFCISQPLENAPSDVEVLSNMNSHGMGEAILYCNSISPSIVRENKIVYIIRDEKDPNRIMTNSSECLDAIISSFRDYEVVPVRFEKMTFKSQVDCVKDCKLLVGSHGAGMTNGLFMQPNSCLLEVFPSLFFSAMIGKSICHKKNIKYDYINGNSILDAKTVLSEFFKKEDIMSIENPKKQIRHVLRDVSFSVDANLLVDRCKRILQIN